ncbi:DnaJ family domain-containing protein [Geodermatophilus sp. SYSU D01119]
MTDRKPPGVSFETWVERQIGQAQERGDFTGLRGTGRPLPAFDPDETVFDWAVAKARREGIAPAEMLPPGLALRRERDDLPARVAGLPSEDAVRAVAEDYNARVEAFWRRPQESRWSPVPGLADVEALVEGWRRDRPPPPPPAAEVPAVTPRDVPPRRRWWQRRRG